MTVGLEDAVVMRSELLEDKVEEDARVSQEPQDTTEFPETKVGFSKRNEMDFARKQKERNLIYYN